VNKNYLACFNGDEDAVLRELSLSLIHSENCMWAEYQERTAHNENKPLSYCF